MAEMFDNLESIGKIISEKAEVVSKKTGEVVEVVAKKTGQTVEIQKIKNRIHVMRKGNERDCRDIGKMIYLKYKKGEEIDEQYLELCEAIAERERAVAEAKEEIARIRGLEVCPNCAKHIESDVVFCPRCGAKIEEE